MTHLLEVHEVHGGYGGADILNGVDLTADEDEVVVIIGPNGAGKSTLMKAVFGLAKVRLGTITFMGKDITGLKTDKVVRRGISYVPQERNVFPSLTVRENLEMGAYLRKSGTNEQMDKIFDLWPRLAERRDQPAGSMSGGERQMVAMGRALMIEPKLMLLDEPTAGLSPKFIDQAFEQILKVRDMGIGILMVEQNARQALAIADRGYVLQMGRNRHEDTGHNLLNDPEVSEMFLGG